MNSPRARSGRETSRLRIPPRTQLSRKPLSTTRTNISPLCTSVAHPLFSALQLAREHLRPWLPWALHHDRLEASHEYTEGCEIDWNRGRALRFYIRLKNRPEIAGVIALDNCSAVHRSCDLGYWLGPTYTGQGLMTEVAQEVLTFALQTVGFHRVRCSASIANVPSQRVIERLGFIKEGVSRDAERVDGVWVTHILYARLATDAAPIWETPVASALSAKG